MSLRLETIRECMEGIIPGHICREGRVGIVYQPLYHLGDGRVVGFEALARFAVEPHRPPNEWFADAAGVGKGGPPAPILNW